MISFSIDKQRDKVKAEWMSRPVDSIKNKIKNQPLVLVLTSMEQSPNFAYRLKRKLSSGPIIGGAYRTTKSKIIFSLKTNKAPDYWETTRTIDELEISFGKEKLKRLKDAIISIPHGKGDYSIAKGDNNILTFWWRV